jgi:hypothetical protein
MARLTVDGERYEALVPDTLDLAEYAESALRGLTGVLDPDGIHEMYFMVGFACHPPFMYKDTTGWPTNNPKFAESLPMLRVMTGSDYDQTIEEKMMCAMQDAIGEDGLFYAIASPERPWHEGVGHKYPPTGEDFANTYGNARMLLALMAWYDRDPTPPLWATMGRMARGLAEMAIKRDDYAYYPDGRIGEAFSRPRSGWRDTSEPEIEPMGAEGSMFMYHGGQIRALSRWYEMSNDSYILDTAARLTRFVLKKKFWGVPGEHPALHGAEHGHFVGHFHGHLSLLRGLLEYGRVTRDTHILDLVRESYEFCRHYGLPQIGWFANGAEEGWCEGCTVADMVALAARLSDTGMGDYWEDVEQMVRNRLVEHELVDIDALRQASLDGPERPRDRLVRQAHLRPPDTIYAHQVVSEHVIERCRGVFGGLSKPDGIPWPWSMQCCTGNGSQALYYAWESIVRWHDGLAQINLLLNRASPWVDIDSYLPYEGKLVVRNKKALAVAVRIPRWVDRARVTLSAAGRAVEPVWVGNYVLCQGLRAGDEVALEFPLAEHTSTYSLDGQAYECRFRGQTLLEITRRCDPPSYQMFVGRASISSAAPLHAVSRFVPDRTMTW